MLTEEAQYQSCQSNRSNNFSKCQRSKVVEEVVLKVKSFLKRVD